MALSQFASNIAKPKDQPSSCRMATVCTCTLAATTATADRSPRSLAINPFLTMAWRGPPKFGTLRVGFFRTS